MSHDPRTLDQTLERARSERQQDPLSERIERLTAQLARVEAERDWMQSTRSWTLTAPLRAASRLVRESRAAISAIASGAQRLAERVERDGARSAISWLSRVTRASLQPRLPDTAFHERQLNQILNHHANRPIIVAPPLVDWNVPLFQRPHQLAMALGAQGFLYFFCTKNSVYDRYDGFVRIGPGCYLTNQTELVLNMNRPKILHICSTAMSLDLDFVERAQRRGDWLLYDYIDELHQDVSGMIPRHAVQRHYALLADESVACIASADKLLRDVADLRTARYALIPNGVELSHFAQARQGIPVPTELRPLVERGGPIIGYFGAFAKWFDYEAVRQLARLRPHYTILLIGHDYDGSIKRAGLEQFSNVTVRKAVNYAHLPAYAQVFDVSTIPFLVNEVTESTSPIKLFEYMALGRPIVSSAMRECLKYRSCIIAESTNEFVARVDQALGLRQDEKYLADLRREAEENTWNARAAAVSDLLHRSFPLR